MRSGPEKTRNVAAKVAAIYALAAGSWILFSDRVLLWFFQDPEVLTRLQSYKGGFFVLATALLLVGLVEHYLRLLRRESEELRLRDRELFRRNELLENIISTIPIYVFWKDRDSVYLGCNRRFATVAGVGSREEIVGKSDKDLHWRREDAEFIRLSDRRIMEKVEPLVDVEETRILADGREAVFLTSKLPLKDESGRVMGLVGIAVDITERKRAEDARKKALAVAGEAGERS